MKSGSNPILFQKTRLMNPFLEGAADEEGAVEEGAPGLLQLAPRPPQQPQLLLQAVELGCVEVGRRAALVPLLDALDLRCHQECCREISLKELQEICLFDF